MSRQSDSFYFELEDVSEEEEVVKKDRSSELYNELMWLKRVKREKEFQLLNGVQVHYGFKCSGCGVINGIGSFKPKLYDVFICRSSRFVSEDSLALTAKITFISVVSAPQK